MIERILGGKIQQRTPKKAEICGGSLAGKRDGYLKGIPGSSMPKRSYVCVSLSEASAPANARRSRKHETFRPEGDNRPLVEIKINNGDV